MIWFLRSDTTFAVGKNRFSLMVPVILQLIHFYFFNISSRMVKVALSSFKISKLSGGEFPWNPPPICISGPCLLCPPRPPPPPPPIQNAFRCPCLFLKGKRISSLKAVQGWQFALNSSQTKPLTVFNGDNQSLHKLFLAVVLRQEKTVEAC